MGETKDREKEQDEGEDDAPPRLYNRKDEGEDSQKTEKEKEQEQETF